MRQKYVVVKNDQDQRLTIKEFAELEKERMSLLCEETYAFEMIKAAIGRGNDALIRALRTNNLYPPSIYADKIAAAVVTLIDDKDIDALELDFNDTELLTIERQSVEGADDAKLAFKDFGETIETDDDVLEDENEQIGGPGSSFKVEDEQ